MDRNTICKREKMCERVREIVEKKEVKQKKDYCLGGNVGIFFSFKFAILQMIT